MRSVGRIRRLRRHQATPTTLCRTCRPDKALVPPSGKKKPPKTGAFSECRLG
ncbi:hypothetical protein HMPREF0208_02197 [Citrobacter koseri]|nr:hypothetical protein HMPREF0208_02197 [Citrobacter koseri]